MSISDISLPAGEPGCESPDSGSGALIPSWEEITSGTNPAIVRVTFDLLQNLKGKQDGGINIPKTMSRLVQFR